MGPPAGGSLIPERGDNQSPLEWDGLRSLVGDRISLFDALVNRV